MATMNKADLVFVLDQIKIAEAHAAGTPLREPLIKPHAVISTGGRDLVTD